LIDGVQLRVERRDGISHGAHRGDMRVALSALGLAPCFARALVQLCAQPLDLGGDAPALLVVLQDVVDQLSRIGVGQVELG
jgi:hypothetical protein